MAFPEAMRRVEFERSDSLAYDMVAECLLSHYEWAIPFFEREHQIRIMDDLRDTAGSMILHAGVDKAFALMCLLAYFVGDVDESWIHVGREGSDVMHGTLACRKDFGVKLDKLVEIGVFGDVEVWGGKEGERVPDPRRGNIEFLRSMRNDFVHFMQITAGVRANAVSRKITVDGITTDYFGGNVGITTLQTFQHSLKWILDAWRDYIERSRLDEILEAMDQAIEQQGEIDAQTLTNYAQRKGWDQERLGMKINGLHAAMFSNRWSNLITAGRQSLPPQ